MIQTDVHKTAAPRRREEATDSFGYTGWLRNTVPIALVLASIVGIAIWGHFPEWQFGRHTSKAGHDVPELAQLVAIRYGDAIATPGDAPDVLRRQVALTFPSAETADKAGIEVAPVWTSPMTDALPASGEMSFDPSRVARLSSRAPGAVWKVLKTLGAAVQAGDVLALIEAADVGKAKAELEQALVQVRLRQKAVNNLRSAGVAVSDRQLKEAESALREADVKLLAGVQTLINLGLPVQGADFDHLSLEEIVQRVRGLGVPANVGFDDKAGTANLLPLRAPFAGVLLTTSAVAGEVVDTGRVLFVVVDPRELWLTLHVPQEQARHVVLGQAVKFRPDGSNTEVISKVAWIGTTANETTRTVPVRAHVANDKGELRASTLGQGRIVVRETPNAIVVPPEAVQSFRGMPIVFVRHPSFLKADSLKEFQVRVVRLGASDDANTEIITGLQPNEIVASKGANLLNKELNRLTQTVAP